MELSTVAENIDTIQIAEHYLNGNLTAINDLTSYGSITYIRHCAFVYLSRLLYVSLPFCSYIEGTPFYSCYSFKSLYLLSTSICIRASYNMFYSCSSFGKIYVPASLLSSYKSATNWVADKYSIYSYVE